MATDPNPTLSAELQAALAVVLPQINGLQTLARTELTEAARPLVESAITGRSHRRDLIVAALAARDGYIAALDALETDGYPALPKIQILGSVFQELQEDKGEVIAGVGVFEAEAQVAAGTFTFPEATPKPSA